MALLAALLYALWRVTVSASAVFPASLSPPPLSASEQRQRLEAHHGRQRRRRRRHLQSDGSSSASDNDNDNDNGNDSGRDRDGDGEGEGGEGSKAYKICTVLGGLDVTRFVSSSTRAFFAGALDDVELIREFVSESMTASASASASASAGAAEAQQLPCDPGAETALSDLGSTLDWSARNYPPNTTTIDANLGYVDDSSQRRFERYVSTSPNAPLVGTKTDDLAIVSAVGTLFPWLVDRKSREGSWHLNHQNGRTEGGGGGDNANDEEGSTNTAAAAASKKVPLPFDSLYTAAWLGTYGEAWAYYPPLTVYGHPLGFGDVLGPAYDSHDEAFVYPNLPESGLNPGRHAFFTDPYPDTAVPGLSLITAMAPVYYTGTFRDNAYDDTYLASTGVDIAVSSVSSLLDVLEDRLTRGSFGMLVDADTFHTIVLSQRVVEWIYPPRTGLEESRVEYSKVDGSVVHDRRNQTYLVSDTILQPLTDLTNADWDGLNADVKKLGPGERGYSVLDINLTARDEDAKSPIEATEFYVMYERWEHVADWVLMVFAPVSEVENAVNVAVEYKQVQDVDDVDEDAQARAFVVLEGRRGGPPVSGSATLINGGTLDVTVSTRVLPPWITLTSPTDLIGREEGGGGGGGEVPLPAGQSLEVRFEASTDGLDLGTSSATLSFLVEDDNYPDCFHSRDVGVDVRVRVMARECDGDKVDDGTGQCACPDGTVGGRCVTKGTVAAAVLVPLALLGLAVGTVYVDRKRRQADSIWAVKPEELRFDDPPEIVGRGTFGLVLLAEYRGTRVAVKRVIPPKAKIKKGRSEGEGGGGGGGGGGAEPIEQRNSLLEKGDQIVVDEEPIKPAGNGSDDAEPKRVHKSHSLSFLTGLDTIGDKDDDAKPLSKVQKKNSMSFLTGLDASGDEHDDAPPVMRKVPKKNSMSFLSRRDTNMRQKSDMMFDFSNDDTMEQAPTPDDMESGTLTHNVMKDNAPMDEDDNRASDCNVESQSTKAAAVKFQVDNAACAETRAVDGTRSGGSVGFDLAFLDGPSNMSGASSWQSSKKMPWKNKHLRRRDEYSRLKADFVQEMRQLSKLRHPCITTIMGAVISSRSEPMLVMEFMDLGSLYDVLHNNTMVIEGELVLPILRDIAQGMRFLHSAIPQVLHGDLKAQNVLVDIKMLAKVADFGLSQKKKVGASGTPFWMAPELLRGETGNTAASDVYSFGMILYEVYSRADPYHGEEPRNVLSQICDPAVNKRPPVPKSMPPAVASLMSDCLIADFESRPTFNELDTRLRRLDVSTIEPGKMVTSHQVAKAKTERNASKLLLEVFPEHIANALRDGRKVEPEHHDCVSIFFSDIVGFTTISAESTPLKVSDMLDRLYVAFDELSRKHEVFKIETIGDAWMGVANLVQDQSDDHTRRIAEFAVDAVKAANKTFIDVDDPDRGYVQIRVGFHSGPVLSNVVGTRNPRFSVFGDTVKTSARMESNSLPGRIHCSDRAATLLKTQGPNIPLSFRGTVSIKGKGEMDTWWVNE